MLGVVITIITVITIVFGGIMVSLFGNNNTKPSLTMDRVRLEFKMGDYEEVVGFSSRDYERSSIFNVYEYLLSNKDSRYSIAEFKSTTEGLAVLRVKKHRVFVPTTVTYGRKNELTPITVYRSFATHSYENYLLFSSDEYTKSSILEVEKYFIKYSKTHHVSWKEYKEDKIILCVAQLEVKEIKTASEMREITNMANRKSTDEILELVLKSAEEKAQKGKFNICVDYYPARDNNINQLYTMISDLYDTKELEERLNKLGYTFEYIHMCGWKISWN